jgi:hypothetical protein
VTGHPLRPVRDRRLGRPLPYQLANLTQAHPIAEGSEESPPFPLRAYAVLACVSTCCPPLLGRFLRVTHPSAARQQEQAPLLPLDLHVLSLPPAFNLSHDQTLQLKVCSLKSYYTNYNLIDSSSRRTTNQHKAIAVSTLVRLQFF